VLEKLGKIPMESWSYKTEVGKPRHVGPMAQDFYAAFGLGSSDKAINEIDLNGISMTAIQALEQRTDELKAKTKEVEALSAETAQLKRQLADTNARLERLERALAKP